MVFKLFFSLMFLAFLSLFAANSDSCQELQDRDHRLFCQAQLNDNSTLCEKIKDDNWRNLCLFPESENPYQCEEFKGEKTAEAFLYYCYAITYGSAMSCFQINEPDMENLCYGHITKNFSHCKYVDSKTLHDLCMVLSEK
jgi:hypothetical protein